MFHGLLLSGTPGAVETGLWNSTLQAKTDGFSMFGPSQTLRQALC